MEKKSLSPRKKSKLQLKINRGKLLVLTFKKSAKNVLKHLEQARFVQKRTKTDYPGKESKFDHTQKKKFRKKMEQWLDMGGLKPGKLPKANCGKCQLYLLLFHHPFCPLQLLSCSQHHGSWMPRNGSGGAWCDAEACRRSPASSSLYLLTRLASIHMQE